LNAYFPYCNSGLTGKTGIAIWKIGIQEEILLK